MPTTKTTATIHQFRRAPLVLLALAIGVLIGLAFASQSAEAADSSSSADSNGAVLAVAGQGDMGLPTVGAAPTTDHQPSCANDYYSVLVASGYDGEQGWSLYHVYYTVVCADGTTIGPFFSHSYVVNW